MIKFIQGNCIDKIKELEDNSIDCVVSSPPYYGLRDYGTATWKGGNDNCNHIEPSGSIKFPGRDTQAHDKRQYKNICKKCGAKRIDEQFGLEKTYQDYIANTVKVFETFKPKLKDTATIWWNVGDTYAMSSMRGKDSLFRSIDQSKSGIRNVKRSIPIGLKAKDLMMIPNRVAIALQDAGWYIRSEIIWHKPNPMPESIRDRPTSCHEKIWLITKNKKYYYDADAIKEHVVESSKKLNMLPGVGGKKYGNNDSKEHLTKSGKETENRLVKNKRNVWKVSTKPFKEAHFATFPKDLIEPCIKSGCPEGGVVLDPFGGAGTTGIVAQSLNRQAILIELNPEYIEISKNRIDKELGMFK